MAPSLRPAKFRSRFVDSNHGGMSGLHDLGEGRVTYRYGRRPGDDSTNPITLEEEREDVKRRSLSPRFGPAPVQAPPRASVQMETNASSPTYKDTEEYSLPPSPTYENEDSKESVQQGTGNGFAANDSGANSNNNRFPYAPESPTYETEEDSKESVRRDTGNGNGSGANWNNGPTEPTNPANEQEDSKESVRNELPTYDNSRYPPLPNATYGNNRGNEYNGSQPWDWLVNPDSYRRNNNIKREPFLSAFDSTNDGHFEPSDRRQYTAGQNSSSSYSSRDSGRNMSFMVDAIPNVPEGLIPIAVHIEFGEAEVPVQPRDNNRRPIPLHIYLPNAANHPDHYNRRSPPRNSTGPSLPSGTPWNFGNHEFAYYKYRPQSIANRPPNNSGTFTFSSSGSRMNPSQDRQESSSHHRNRRHDFGESDSRHRNRRTDTRERYSQDQGREHRDRSDRRNRRPDSSARNGY